MLLLLASLLCQSTPAPEQAPASWRDSIRLGGWLDGQYANSSKREVSPRFDVRQLNLHVHAEVSPHWRAMAELSLRHLPNVDSEGSSGEILLDRAYIEYRMRTEMGFRFGKFNTPAGLWKPQNYSVLVDSTEAPLAEGDHFIPSKSVGLGFFSRRLLSWSEWNGAAYLNNGYQDSGTESSTDDDPGWGLDLNALVRGRHRLGASHFQHRGEGSEELTRSTQMVYLESGWRKLDLRLVGVHQSSEAFSSRRGAYAQLKVRFRPQWYALFRRERSHLWRDQSWSRAHRSLLTLAWWPHNKVRTRLEWSRTRGESAEAQPVELASIWIGLIF